MTVVLDFVPKSGTGKIKEEIFMNKVILLGRIVNDPEVHYPEGGNTVTVARYRLAVNRRYHKDGEAEADFITCVAFGKNAEVAQKYFKKGLKISVSGRIRTGSYTNSEGRKVYTTEVYIEEHDIVNITLHIFCTESLSHLLQ